MTGYAAAPPPFDASLAARSRAEVDRAVPITVDDPAFLYLTKLRAIPAATVLGCPDLRLLPAPIAGRERVDFACVSLLRPAPDAEPTGAELAFVDILGQPSATAPNRVQWRFVENGCRDAWFWAGAVSGAGDTAYVAEGFLVKALAVVSLGLPGWVMGWGARSWLQFKSIPPASIKTLVIIADRRPS